MINNTMNTNRQNFNTLFVFSEGNQVYLKKNVAHTSSEDIQLNEEWFPIHFQWGVNF